MYGTMETEHEIVVFDLLTGDLVIALPLNPYGVGIARAMCEWRNAAALAALTGQYADLRAAA